MGQLSAVTRGAKRKRDEVADMQDDGVLQFDAGRRAIGSERFQIAFQQPQCVGFGGDRVHEGILQPHDPRLQGGAWYFQRDMLNGKCVFD